MNNKEIGGDHVRMTMLQNLQSTKYARLNYWLQLCWCIIRQMILVGLSFVVLYPILIKVITCFMSFEDLANPLVKLIPRQGSLVILTRAIQNLEYGKTLLRTAALSGMVAIIQTVISCTAGYGLARFAFKGRNLLFFMVIATLLVPPQTILIPEFVNFRYFKVLFWEFNLINTSWPFVILSFTGLGLKNGLYIFLMRQFFRGLPKELEESAYIDGASPVRAFISVMAPNARNMMLTVFVLSFTWQWTDSHITPMFLPNEQVFSNIMPETSVLDQVQYIAINNVSALLIILPVLLIYIFAQRFIIQGVEQSGIVG